MTGIVIYCITITGDKMKNYDTLRVKISKLPNEVKTKIVDSIIPYWSKLAIVDAFNDTVDEKELTINMRNAFNETLIGQIFSKLILIADSIIKNMSVTDYSEMYDILTDSELDGLLSCFGNNCDE